jgi:hypothetical protein
MERREERLLRYAGGVMLHTLAQRCTLVSQSYTTVFPSYTLPPRVALTLSPSYTRGYECSIPAGFGVQF